MRFGADSTLESSEKYQETDRGCTAYDYAEDDVEVCRYVTYLERGEIIEFFF